MNAIFEIERVDHWSEFDVILRGMFLAMLVEAEAEAYHPPFRATHRNVDLFFETTIEPAFEQDKALVLLAFMDGVASGVSFWTLDCSPFEKDYVTAFGHGTYVVPQHRKKGIATRLRRQGEEILRDMGARVVIGMIDDRNASAQKSALRGGFQVVGSLVRKLL